MYLIEILHQTTTCGKCEDCLRRCILSKFYIKPQLARIRSYSAIRCILSKFYIKPQRDALKSAGNAVVSYRNSTSNHNPVASLDTKFTVVSYRNSTSNHNKMSSRPPLRKLYLIEILHQTTTGTYVKSFYTVLYLIEILHQTTTSIVAAFSAFCCILSKFYIKPQQRSDRLICLEVVSYRNSTSNHNNPRYLPNRKNVVSYRNSTSNHNKPTTSHFFVLLYLIEILHQTTTSSTN